MNDIFGKTGEELACFQVTETKTKTFFSNKVFESDVKGLVKEISGILFFNYEWRHML